MSEKPKLRDDDASGTALIGQMTKIGGRPHTKKLDVSAQAEKLDWRLHNEAVKEGLERCGPTRNSDGGK
jgi:hypothetical protein